MPSLPFLLFHSTEKARKYLNSLNRSEEGLFFSWFSAMCIIERGRKKASCVSCYHFTMVCWLSLFFFSKELFHVSLLLAMLHALIFQHNSTLLTLPSCFHIFLHNRLSCPRAWNIYLASSYRSNVSVGHNSAFAVVSLTLWKHIHTEEQLHQQAPGIPYVGAEFTQVKFYCT